MTREPLSRFRMAQTADPVGLRNAVDGLTDYEHAVQRLVRPQGRDRALGVVNGSRQGTSALAFVSYGIPTEVTAPPTGDKVLIVCPLGPMEVTLGASRNITKTPFTLPSTSKLHMVPDPTEGALIGAVPRASLLEALHAAFGFRRVLELQVDAEHPLKLERGVAMTRQWREFPADLDQSLETLLLDTILVGLAPYAKYRQPGDQILRTAPSYLTSALRYLHNNYAEPVSLLSLSDAVGVSHRQLQLTFQVHLGCTPQRFLRNIRLDRARCLLLETRTDRKRTVASIAVEVGLPHLGRFAQYFDERFGVLPSTILET